MNVHLHIDRLVLEGLELSPHDQHFVRTALIGELTRLIETGGLSSSLAGASPRLAPPAITVAPGVTPECIGRQVAGSIYRGMGVSETMASKGTNP